MREKYIDKLITCIKEAQLDAVMICPGEEMNFLLGFSPMLCERFQGLFIKADREMFYICNLLYRDELRAQLPENIPVFSWFDGEVMTEIVKTVLEEQGLIGKKIGVNSDAQAFNVLEIMDKVNVTFTNAKPLFEEMRMIKNTDELNALRQAASIADQAFADVLSVIRPGISEGEILEFLMTRMTELGGESPEGLVAAGAHSSYPHYCGTNGIVKEQDVVLLDYGCTCSGLHSDMSRTVFVGSITEHQRECYELVKRSNEEAEAMVAEGAWIPDIEKHARDVLDEKGYAKTLINRLGHGIGYTIHEAPDIKQSNPRNLERGMAFSIEPGIYLGGDFGIRIEDIVIVNEKGEAEILNKSSKELIVL